MTHIRDELNRVRRKKRPTTLPVSDSSDGNELVLETVHIIDISVDDDGKTIIRYQPSEKEPAQTISCREDIEDVMNYIIGEPTAEEYRELEQKALSYIKPVVDRSLSRAKEIYADPDKHIKHEHDLATEENQKNTVASQERLEQAQEKLDNSFRGRITQKLYDSIQTQDESGIFISNAFKIFSIGQIALILQEREDEKRNIERLEKAYEKQSQDYERKRNNEKDWAKKELVRLQQLKRERQQSHLEHILKVYREEHSVLDSFSLDNDADRTTYTNDNFKTNEQKSREFKAYLRSREREKALEKQQEQNRSNDRDFSR